MGEKSSGEVLEVRLLARSAAIYLWDAQNATDAQVSRLFSIPTREGLEQFWRGLNLNREIGSIDEVGGRGSEVEQSYRERGTRIVCPGDSMYPDSLYVMRHAPILGVRGSVESLRRPQVSIVGSREALKEASGMTEKIVGHLVSRGVVITSGGALGVDALAHRSAMRAGGETIVVSAMGTEHVFPQENRDIFEYASGYGAVVSQFPNRPIGHRPNFPMRNDVIAGLSLGTVIVHCREKSGALYTVQASRRMHREVFVAAMMGFEKLTEGGLKLVKRGEARLLSELSQIDEILPLPGGGYQRELPLFESAREVEGVCETEKRVLEVLRGGGVFRDVLRIELGSPKDFDETLLELELDGKIRYSNGVFEICR